MKCIGTHGILEKIVAVKPLERESWGPYKVGALEKVYPISTAVSTI